MAGTDFNTLISSLHNSVHEDDYDTANNKNLLIINNKRQFSTTADFDAVIAYEGDINSQIITIQCPKTHDGHDLSLCDYKELRWKNLGSGAEGVSKLLVDDTTSTENLYLRWEVPSDACTQAGTLEISLAFYDKSGEYIAFAWNTAKYTGLIIGKTIESVNFAFPPKDEILIIDKDTKSIIAPIGYNNVVCNYGESGLAEVYFLINRYIGKNTKIDVMNATVKVYMIVGGKQGLCSSAGDNPAITKQLYTEEIKDRENEGLVLIKWKLPIGLTSGTFGPGSFSIMVGVEYSSGEDSFRWYSNTYTNLTIGENLFQISEEDIEDWDITKDMVMDIIDEYLKNTIL